MNNNILLIFYSRSTNTESKNGLGVGTLSTEPAGVTSPQALPIQLLLRMPDGKLLQLSALPVEHIASSGANHLVQPSQVYYHYSHCQI